MAKAALVPAPSENVAAATDEIARKQRKIDLALAEAARPGRHAELAEAEAEKLRAELAEATAERDRLKTGAGERERELNALVASAKADLQGVSLTATTFQERVTAAENESAKLRAELDDVRLKLEEPGKLRATLDDVQSKLQEQTAKLRGELDDARAKGLSVAGWAGCSPRHN